MTSRRSRARPSPRRAGTGASSVIIACKGILLSALLELYKATNDQKAIRLLEKLSPVAWQHLHFLGRYLFHGNGH